MSKNNSPKSQDTLAQDGQVVEVAHRGAIGIYRTKKQLFLANLLGGLAWGAGSVLGASILVAAIAISLTWLGGLPVIGSFFNQVTEAIKQAGN